MDIEPPDDGKSPNKPNETHKCLSSSVGDVNQDPDNREVPINLVEEQAMDAVACIEDLQTEL